MLRWICVGFFDRIQKAGRFQSEEKEPSTSRAQHSNHQTGTTLIVTCSIGVLPEVATRNEESRYILSTTLHQRTTSTLVSVSYHTFFSFLGFKGRWRKWPPKFEQKNNKICEYFIASLSIIVSLVTFLQDAISCRDASQLSAEEGKLHWQGDFLFISTLLIQNSKMFKRSLNSF